MQVTISDRCSFKLSAYQVHIDFEAPDKIQAINLIMGMAMMSFVNLVSRNSPSKHWLPRPTTIDLTFLPSFLPGDQWTDPSPSCESNHCSYTTEYILLFVIHFIHSLALSCLILRNLQKSLQARIQLKNWKN